MNDNYENSYKFFANTACQYFPCHDVSDKKSFNCLFCYCPLYFLGDKCGGNFNRIGEGGNVKDCSNCLIPHRIEKYELIINKICENINQF